MAKSGCSNALNVFTIRHQIIMNKFFLFFLMILPLMFLSGFGCNSVNMNPEARTISDECLRLLKHFRQV